MEVMLASCSVTVRCLVDLKSWLADYNGFSFVNLLSSRTRSKQQRIPCGLASSLRLGYFIEYRSAWFEIWLILSPTHIILSLNRISYFTEAGIEISDEKSTITICVSMVCCYWAWPIPILKACSLAITKDGSTSVYHCPLSSAKGSILFSSVRKLKFSWFFKNLETLKNWFWYESLNPNTISLIVLASYVVFRYVLGRISGVEFSCLGIVLSLNGCSPTILQLDVYFKCLSSRPDSYRMCLDYIRRLIRSSNLCSLAQTMVHILLFLDKVCIRMCCSLVLCMLLVIAARSMRPIPHSPVHWFLICYTRTDFGWEDRYAETLFFVVIKGSTLFSVAYFKGGKLVLAAARTRIIGSLIVSLIFHSIILLAKSVGVKILEHLYINGVLDGLIAPILCFNLLNVCCRMPRGCLIPRTKVKINGML